MASLALTMRRRRASLATWDMTGLGRVLGLLGAVVGSALLQALGWIFLNLYITFRGFGLRATICRFRNRPARWSNRPRRTGPLSRGCLALTVSTPGDDLVVGATVLDGGGLAAREGAAGERTGPARRCRNWPVKGSHRPRSTGPFRTAFRGTVGWWSGDGGRLGTGHWLVGIGFCFGGQVRAEELLASGPPPVPWGGGVTGEIVAS
mmetsp:Transcript_132950/g.230545  ORF Transcript_132950/g.230545 Transcript_132950/m.230545 type:complete len:206 (+) Transcript_132950:1007-1624(+)